MIELDARNPADVSSPFVLDVDIGSPARHMLIFTGIAAARWDSRSDLDRTQVRVRLNRTVANLGLYTATAALSNITNTDSDFIFCDRRNTVGA
jgi:hypothetical protein